MFIKHFNNIKHVFFTITLRHQSLKLFIWFACTLLSAHIIQEEINQNTRGTAPRLWNSGCFFCLSALFLYFL